MLLALLAGASACQRMKKTQHVEPEPTGAREISQSVTGGAAVEYVGPERVTVTDLDAPPQPDVRDVVFVEGDLNPVYFAFDSVALASEARMTLEYNAKILKENPDIWVLIEGHCDERGTVEYNLALGEGRALAVRRYLINLGIGPDRIATISFGEEKPTDLGHQEQAWAKNRRVEYKVAD